MCHTNFKELPCKQRVCILLGRQTWRHVNYKKHLSWNFAIETQNYWSRAPTFERNVSSSAKLFSLKLKLDNFSFSKLQLTCSRFSIFNITKLKSRALLQ